MPKKQRRPSPPSAPLPVINTPVDVIRLSNECRGIALHGGKTLFIRNALPGEQVLVRVEASHKRFDEAGTIEVVKSSPDRVNPVCQHYQQCGGCDLQHLNTQVAPGIKQQLVVDLLQRFSDVSPEQIDNPIESRPTGYRRSARIGINQRQRDGALLTGFRRRQSAKLLNIEHCPILDSRLDSLFQKLHETLAETPDVRHITEVLVSLGDSEGALRFRAVKPLSSTTQQCLVELGKQLQLSIWLEDHQQNLTPLHHQADLGFQADPQTQLFFQPGDFLQVNAEVNRAMIARAKEWLDPQPEQTLLDLFCGLGNFALPLARHLKQVVGVEGSQTMVSRAQQNALHNQLHNTDFYCADLSQPIKETAWYRQHRPDLILLDPPRSGAAELIPQLLPLKPRKILYIACNPAALARDAGTLAAAGYAMTRFSVLDMFPNTSHIESMALFEVRK